MIELSRHTVAASMALIVNLINNLVEGAYTAEAHRISVADNFIWNMVLGFLHIINLIAFTMSIWFMFPFAHVSYLKCCRRCHNYVYNKFEGLNQNQYELMLEEDENEQQHIIKYSRTKPSINNLRTDLCDNNRL